MKHLTLLEPIRKEGNYQFFMQWFADAWTTSGGQTVKGISVPWNLRLLIAKSRVSRNFRPVSYTHLTLPTICSV